MAARKTTVKAAEEKKVNTVAKAEKTVEKTAPAVETKAEEVKPAAKKSTVKKAPAEKKVTKKQTLYLQFAGKEIQDKEIMDKVKEIWTKELGNKLKDMADVKVYLKPEESCAYYVVNDEVSGKFYL